MGAEQAHGSDRKKHPAGVPGQASAPGEDRPLHRRPKALEPAGFMVPEHVRREDAPRHLSIQYGRAAAVEITWRLGYCGGDNTSFALSANILPSYVRPDVDIHNMKYNRAGLTTASVFSPIDRIFAASKAVA